MSGNGGPTRRTVLVGAGALAGLGALGAGAAVAAGLPLPGRVRGLLGRPDPTRGIPDAPEGEVRLERRRSDARDRQVGFWTAVPAGHGDGSGLPVCLVLHGASATTADYGRFGLARFLTAAVRAGVPPFVLAGADGGRTFWLGDGTGDDPQRMLREELPAWCAGRGFDTTRMALYGWSMGGHGALAFAQALPPEDGRGWARSPAAVAALSPAVSRGDDVFGAADRLSGLPLGLWCGTDDPLLPEVQALAAAVRPAPAVTGWAPGGHTREYWNTVTPAAFRLVGSRLGA